MTFIEVLVVLTLIAIVGRTALLVSFDSYRGSSFRSGRDNLIEALEHARAQAMNNVCLGASCAGASPHGVSIEGDHYVIFQGGSYAHRDAGVDEIIDASPTLSYQGPSEIVFATSSGEVSQLFSITLRDTSGHSSTITIGTEGQISWTQ